MVNLDKIGSRSDFRYPFPVSMSNSKKRITELVEKHWLLNRTAVNTDTDILVNYLKELTSAEIIEAGSGEEVLTWRVPKHWKVNKGLLKNKAGLILADFVNNPLHLWTHSVSFKGEISREELIKSHICSDPDRPDEFLYHYRNGYRYDAQEWGFCLPYNLVKELNEPFYEVEIETELDNNGTLKVVNAYLPGRLKETIFIASHTCHPAMVSDGIANIAVALELFHYLNSLKERKYSYRFIFGPEYFASAVFLAGAGKEVVKNLKYGIYLDMLSNHEPLGFQSSFQGDTLIDIAAKNVLKSHTGIFTENPYRELWGNDEMFYNGPGFEIPTIGLGRGMHREYHYNTDNIENMNMYHILESSWILQRIIEVFETDFVPVRKYEGPLYLSRYGLYIDPGKDLKGYKNLEKIQIMADGKNSCFDIASKLEIDYFFVKDFFEKLADMNLVDKNLSDIS